MKGSLSGLRASEKYSSSCGTTRNDLNDQRLEIVETLVVKVV
jgi:hypothetical protein